MKVFIDFDDVIFNTKEFSKDYKKIFEECGVCKDIFHELYYDYPQKDKSGKLKKYNYQKHVSRIGEECQMDTKELENKVGELITDTSKYVFPDVKDFLNHFSKNNLFLVSYGRNDFQEKKIFNSGLSDFFEKMLIVDDLKSVPILEIVEGEERAYFLDDRMEQVEDIKKNIENSVTFLVKRKEGRYDDEPNEFSDFVIKNLQEAEKEIKK